jgi:hypothetical protein
MTEKRRVASLIPECAMTVVDDRVLTEAIREAKAGAGKNGDCRPVDADYVVTARNAKGVGVELRMIIPPEMAAAIDDILWERGAGSSRKYPWRTRADLARWCVFDGLKRLAGNSQAPAKSMVSLLAAQKALISRFLLMENGDDELRRVEDMARTFEAKGKSPVKYLRKLLSEAEENLPDDSGDDLLVELATSYIDRLRRLIGRYAL